MKTASLIILLLIPLSFSHAQASSPSPVTALLTGLHFPVSLKFAPDGRIFFNEKNTGNIRILLPNGTLLPTPLATVTPLFNGGEAGLLGLALDPAFTSNSYVYVYYTDRDSQNYTRGTSVGIQRQATRGPARLTYSASPVPLREPSITTAATSNSDPTANSTPKSASSTKANAPKTRPQQMARCSG